MLFLHHMATNSFLLQLFLILAIFLSYTKSIDFNYPAVFNFGDSNSDTGNLVTAGIEGLGPPNGQTYFQKPSGRYCDVDAMDMPFLNAYLDSIAAPIFKKGSNFAAAGSTILPAAATSVSPFSFGIQKLYDEGARNYWIHNMGPLGCLPKTIAKFGMEPSKLDELGCVSTLQSSC